MQADISTVAYFAPILSFLLVLSVVFAILVKTKILGDNKIGLIFVSLIIATIFVSFAGVREYVLTITPWIAVLIISLFFILLLVGFVGKDMVFMNKGIGIGVLIVAGLIFLISGFVVFSDVISQHVPFSDQYQVNPATGFLYSPRVVGAVVLLIVAGIASWILVKSS
jgi:hypothetical protein